MKRLLVLLSIFLASCASTADGRARQREIAMEMVREQAVILAPLMDEQTQAYVSIVLDALEGFVDGGEVNWEATLQALDALEPIVVERLLADFDEAEARAIVASFRSALRTVQLLSVE